MYNLSRKGTKQTKTEKDEKKRKKFLTRGIKCDIIPKVNQILGYSQAVRHQTLTLAFSLVRIQLPQPNKNPRSQECGFLFVLFIFHYSSFIIHSSHTRIFNEEWIMKSLRWWIMNNVVEIVTSIWYNIFISEVRYEREYFNW